jgi:hypothetical protein
MEHFITEWGVGEKQIRWLGRSALSGGAALQFLVLALTRLDRER